MNLLYCFVNFKQSAHLKIMRIYSSKIGFPSFLKSQESFNLDFGIQKYAKLKLNMLSLISSPISMKNPRVINFC